MELNKIEIRTHFPFGPDLGKFAARGVIRPIAGTLVTALSAFGLVFQLIRKVIMPSK